MINDIRVDTLGYSDDQLGSYLRLDHWPSLNEEWIEDYVLRLPRTMDIRLYIERVAVRAIFLVTPSALSKSLDIRTSVFAAIFLSRCSGFIKWNYPTCLKRGLCALLGVRKESFAKSKL